MNPYFGDTWFWACSECGRTNENNTAVCAHCEAGASKEGLCEMASSESAAGKDTPSCSECGQETVQNGTAYQCPNCGASVSEENSADVEWECRKCGTWNFLEFACRTCGYRLTTGKIVPRPSILSLIVSMAFLVVILVIAALIFKFANS